MPGGQSAVAEAAFRAFDANGDDRLSYAEYGLTPSANPVGERVNRRRDLDDDGRLSRAEFVGDAECTALFGYQFDRLDANDDGLLSLDEFPFRVELEQIPTEIAHGILDEDDDGRVSYDGR